MLQSVTPDSPEFSAAIQLLRPEGMGRTFKVLVQHKGMPRPELDGLTFQPFFGTALVATEQCAARPTAVEPVTACDSGADDDRRIVCHD